MPGIWTESVRRTCRLGVTAFLLFGLEIALSGCAVSTTEGLGIASSSDGDPDSIIGKSMGSFLHEYGLPNAHAQFVNDSDGTTFFVYETYTLQKTTLYWPYIILALAATGGGGSGGGNYPDLTYEGSEDHCVLLRFGPDGRLLDYAVKDRREGDNCTDEFASRLAGTRNLPTDVVMDELKGALRTQSSQGDIEAATYLAVTFDEFGPLEEFGANGDSATAYQIHQAAMNRPENGAIAWKWLCRAAELGNVRARREAAWWHTSNLWEGHPDEWLKWARVAGLGPDNRVAYMWYTVAASDGDKQALGYRSFVVQDMTDDQVVEAEQMVQEWKPGQCPAPWPSAATTVQ